MSFKESKYLVIENILSSEITNFCYEYFLLKKKVYDTFLEKKYVSAYDESFGYYERSTDQMPGTFSHYGDVAMEILLQKVKPTMEKKTDLKLIETYSYARVYKKGDVLQRHKDRPSCEISTTLNLGGDPWPIFIEPDPSVGIKNNETKIYTPGNTAGKKINLKPGDMLIYSGCSLEHWREPFKGNQCVQVFLHYNNIETQGEGHKFDKRFHLGLPLMDEFKC